MMIVALARLADDQQTQMGKLIDDAGPIAGLFVVALGVAIFFLWRSLRKQISRIDPSLPQGEHDQEQELDRKLTQEAVERGEAAEDGSAPGEQDAH